MDDFDAVFSAAKGGEQAVFHAAAMRAKEAGIEKAGSSVKKDVIANEEDYREHTMEMAQHNAVAGCGVGAKYLTSLKDDSLEKVGSAFKGFIDEGAAKNLYKSAVAKWTSDDGILKVPHAGGKTAAAFNGFVGYGDALGDLELQKKSSAIIGDKWLVGHSQKQWPELYNVYEEVNKHFGRGATVHRAHFLFCKSRAVCFQFHKDTYDHAKAVHFSVCLELSDSKSTMLIAGEDPLRYDKAGAFCAFPSDLWHRSGVAQSHTMKLTFFYIVSQPEEAGGQLVHLLSSFLHLPFSLLHFRCFERCEAVGKARHGEEKD